MKRGGFWTRIGGRHVELERVDVGWTKEEIDREPAIGLLHSRLLDFRDAGLGTNEYEQGVMDGLEEAILVLKGKRTEEIS